MILLAARIINVYAQRLRERTAGWHLAIRLPDAGAAQEMRSIVR
jgi:hypothetical protein